MIKSLLAVSKVHSHLHHDDNEIYLNNEVDENGHHCNNVMSIYSIYKKGSSLPIMVFGDTLFSVL